MLYILHLNEIISSFLLPNLKNKVYLQLWEKMQKK